METTKFHEADRVELNRNFNVYKAGAQGSIYEDGPDSDGDYRIRFDNGDGEPIYVPEGYVIEAGSGSTSKKNVLKASEVNYLLQYDMDTDPVEEFKTLEELEARVKELLKSHEGGGQLRRDSFVVYKVESKKFVEYAFDVNIVDKTSTRK